MSYLRNVNKEVKNFFVPNLQCYQFEQAGWKIEPYSGKSKLSMNL